MRIYWSDHLSFLIFWYRPRRNGGTFRWRVQSFINYNLEIWQINTCTSGHPNSHDLRKKVNGPDFWAKSKIVTKKSFLLLIPITHTHTLCNLIQLKKKMVMTTMMKWSCIEFMPPKDFVKILSEKLIVYDINRFNQSKDMWVTVFLISSTTCFG